MLPSPEWRILPTGFGTTQTQRHQKSCKTQQQFGRHDEGGPVFLNMQQLTYIHRRSACRFYERETCDHPSKNYLAPVPSNHTGKVARRFFYYTELIITAQSRRCRDVDLGSQFLPRTERGKHRLGDRQEPGKFETGYEVGVSRPHEGKYRPKRASKGLEDRQL